MRLAMFRLQGVIAEQLSQPMVRSSFFLFTNKPHTHLSQGHLRLVALQEHEQLVNLLVTPLQ